MEKSGYFQGLKIKKSASVIDKKGKKSYTITNKYTQIKGRADPALSRERKKEKNERHQEKSYDALRLLRAHYGQRIFRKRNEG
jgi:hypothetical protein